MKKVLVIGFEPYNEMMFPHTYDFLKVLEPYCNLVYFGGDDRGRALVYISSTEPKPFNLISWLKFLKNYFGSRYKIRNIENKVKRLMDENVDVVIAIDHSALHCACKFLKKGTKLIFWSHDYFAPDYKWINSFWVRRLVRNNEEDIRKCKFIIVQDVNRASVLDWLLGSHCVPKLYLPASLSNDPFCENEAKERRSRPSKENINIMQLGGISGYNYSSIILEAYQGLAGNIHLIFKGIIASDIYRLAMKLPRKPIFHPKSPSFREMHIDVNQADIGILAYGGKDLNCYFVSRASCQLVEYLRLGIPVIALDAQELGSFVEENKCGVYIIDINQLSWAIQKIIKGYHSYSENARGIFEKYFNIDLYTQELHDKVFS